MEKQATPTKNRECFLFDTFLAQTDFKSAYAELKNFDNSAGSVKMVPEKKGNVSEKSHEKKYEDAYKSAYTAFKKVEKSMTDKGEKPDFSKRETLKKMYTGIMEELRKDCIAPLAELNVKNEAIGAGRTKLAIGTILVQYAGYVAKGIGLREKSNGHQASQAMTAKHGVILKTGNIKEA